MASKGARCEPHAAKLQREVDQRRGSAASRGYDGKWAKARTSWLRAHPLCMKCESEQRVVSATVVDHIVPHKGDRKLFWDSANWQSLCKSHHDEKTAREDGRWG